MSVADTPGTEPPRDAGGMAWTEESLRFLADHLPQLVWSTTADGYHDYFNQRWYDFTGMPREGAQGWNWKNFLHPDDFERAVEVWSRALRTGEPYEIEYRFKRASDGEYRWFIGRALPQRGADGRVVRWFGTCTDIHDQKAAEAERERLVQELARQRGELNRVFAQAPAAICASVGPEHRIELANGRYRALVGGRELVGRTVREAFPEMESQGFFDLLDRVYATGEPYEGREVHARIQRPEGMEDGYFDFMYQPLSDADGQVYGILTHVVDATERVRARLERERMEMQYRTLARNYPDGAVVLFDRDLRFLVADGAGLAAVGLSSEAMEGRTVWEVFPPDTAAMVAAQYRAALDGHARRGEVSYAGRAYLMHTLPVRDDTGAVFAGMVVTQDVSELKETEEALRHARAAAEEARAELFRVFSQAPVAICVLRGAEHVFELANPAYQRLLGGRDPVGKPLREVIPEAEAQGFGKLLDGVLRTGHPFVADGLRLEYDRAGTGRAEEAFFNLVYHPLRGADGRVEGVVTVAAEVTEQVRARREAEALAHTLEEQATELARQYQESHLLAEELRASNEEMRAATHAAEEANRSKSQFLANMSHELRTPLNAIGGYIDLIEAGISGDINDAQRRYLDRVKRAQQHLLGLINDVLNFAKLEAGRVEILPTVFPVRQAVVQVEELIAPLAAAKEITYERAPSPPATVFADRDKVEQVLLNLLSNAVKFTDRGGRVRVSWSAEGGTLSLRVADTGTGIPADRLDAIFDPFVQVNADLTRTAQGTGLGLAISRELARAMGGDLTVRSELGEGSEFVLRLPEREQGTGNRE